MSDAPEGLPTDTPPLAIWIGFIAMVVGQFMAVLDIQIVASALGAIQAGVSASRDEISWVQTSYLIAEVIGIPLSGFLGRALGTRLLFCLSALGFTFSSLLCAFAWDINSLIAFRAAAGLQRRGDDPDGDGDALSRLPAALAADDGRDDGHGDHAGAVAGADAWRHDR